MDDSIIQSETDEPYSSPCPDNGVAHQSDNQNAEVASETPTKKKRPKKQLKSPGKKSPIVTTSPDTDKDTAKHPNKNKKSLSMGNELFHDQNEDYNMELGDGTVLTDGEHREIHSESPMPKILTNKKISKKRKHNEDNETITHEKQEEVTEEPKKKKLKLEKSPKVKLHKAVEESDTDQNVEKVENKSASTKKKKKLPKVEAALDDEDKADIEFERVPIEQIVSKSDMDLFEEARRKSKPVTAPIQGKLPAGEGVKEIFISNLSIETWYPSQYPIEYRKLGMVFICEFCLKYMKSENKYRRHMDKCELRYPPGDEIYRKNNISVFEVDGDKAVQYCQNLCLLAKLFLDHKTVDYDVAPFLFYIMIQSDQKGCHIIGYFSKEKSSFLKYNVSCILVFPQYMKKGYGKFLIDFSYLLTKTEDTIGSPERPLSDLGLVTYRSYWTDVLLQTLSGYDDESEKSFCIRDLSVKTGIHPNDIVSTLQHLGILKYHKSEHLIHMKKELLESFVKRVEKRPSDFLCIDPSALKWAPKTKMDVKPT